MGDKIGLRDMDFRQLYVGKRGLKKKSEQQDDFTFRGEADARGYNRVEEHARALRETNGYKAEGQSVLFSNCEVAEG